MIHDATKFLLRYADVPRNAEVLIVPLPAILQDLFTPARNRQFSIIAHCFAGQPIIPMLHFPQNPLGIDPQVFVNLLKHSLCHQEAQRIVLTELGSYYQRSFQNLCDFVASAEQHASHLDLRTPFRVK